MEIVVRGRHVTVPPRFRQHAVDKLAKLGRLDRNAMRIDVDVSNERNPRQSDRRERVELTIRSRGPAIRAEAAADDRYTALDLAFAKLESRLRRACDRRKIKHTDNETVRSPGALAAVAPLMTTEAGLGSQAAAAGPQVTRVEDDQIRTAAPDGPADPDRAGPGSQIVTAPLAGAEVHASPNGHSASVTTPADGNFVPIQMEGDGPLVVREKVHKAAPMTIDQALLEMELVGHDFFLYHDSSCDTFSVVYRRCGYDYGVIRLVEE